jgi:hypothetical protein
MLIASLLTTRALADPTPPSDLLNKCDAALNAKIKEAELCSIGIDFRNKEIERVYKENEELRSKGTGLLNNPFVWTTLGLVVGAFVTSRVVR